MLLIDGMRYDFSENNPSDPWNQKQRFKSFDQIYNANPNKQFQYRSYADPPTSTGMRLKSLQTGYIPNQADILRAFSPVKSSQTNASLAKSAGIFTVVIGDNMWIDSSDKSHWSYQQTKNTCQFVDLMDSYVQDYIDNQLFKDKSGDQSLTYLHLTDMDNLFHKHANIDNDELLNVVHTYDKQIMDIQDRMDDNTLLVMFGDHGIKSDGNHGGSTFDEVWSSIIMTSKSVVWDKRNMSEGQSRNWVYQIDLVPTLSYILNTDVPILNQGLCIYDVCKLQDIQYQNILEMSVNTDIEFDQINVKEQFDMFNIKIMDIFEWNIDTDMDYDQITSTNQIQSNQDSLTNSLRKNQIPKFNYLYSSLLLISSQLIILILNKQKIISENLYNYIQIVIYHSIQFGDSIITMEPQFCWLQLTILIIINLILCNDRLELLDQQFQIKHDDLKELSLDEQKNSKFNLEFFILATTTLLIQLPIDILNHQQFDLIIGVQLLIQFKNNKNLVFCQLLKSILLIQYHEGLQWFTLIFIMIISLKPNFGKFFISNFFQYWSIINTENQYHLIVSILRSQKLNDQSSYFLSLQCFNLHMTPSLFSKIKVNKAFQLYKNANKVIHSINIFSYYLGGQIMFTFKNNVLKESIYFEIGCLIKLLVMVIFGIQNIYGLHTFDIHIPKVLLDFINTILMIFYSIV